MIELRKGNRRPQQTEPGSDCYWEVTLTCHSHPEFYILGQNSVGPWSVVKLKATNGNKMKIFVLFSFLSIAALSLGAYAGGENLVSELAPERERLVNTEQYCRNHCQCKGDFTYCYCPWIGGCYCVLGDRSNCRQKKRECQNLPEWKNTEIDCTRLAEIGEPCEQGQDCHCRRSHTECHCPCVGVCACREGTTRSSYNICLRKESKCKKQPEWANHKFICSPPENKCGR